MSEAEGERFVFTSGRPSPHHTHTGYGLKDGLEGASFDVIRRLEAPCLVLAHAREALEGELILSVYGRLQWRGAVEVMLGVEPSGRPNARVQGDAPPQDLLLSTPDGALGWSIESVGVGGAPVIRVLIEPDEKLLASARRKRLLIALLMLLLALVLGLLYLYWVEQSRPKWRAL